MKINDEDVERDWKPGDKAFIEVEVLGVDRGFAAVDTHDGPGYRACATVRADRLRPAPDGDAIERAKGIVRHAVITTYREKSRDLPPPYATGDLADDVIGALAAANLLASPVREPGRSEAEIVEISRALMDSLIDGRWSEFEGALAELEEIRDKSAATPRAGRTEAEVKAERGREALKRITDEWAVALDVGCPSCGPIGSLPCDHIEGYHHAYSDLLAAQVTDTEGSKP